MLTAIELDALAEIFNLGVGQAAHALSQISGDHVQLSVPDITLHTREGIARRLDSLGCTRLCAVRQGFAGLLNTEAMLMFPVDQSLVLVQMMVGGDMPLEQLSEMEQEALGEVGNILLNAVVGSMADVLRIEFQGSLPLVELGSPDELMVGGNPDDSQVLHLKIDFRIDRRALEGHLAFMLDIDSVARLKLHIQQFLETEAS